VKLVDSHCHLDDSKFDEDREQVIERARAAGVERMLAIGTGDGPPDLETATRLADRYPFIYATIGVHPHEASKAQPETYDSLRALTTHPKVLGIGEIGLDYHYDFAPRDLQQEVFAAQIDLARELDLPIIIHTREATDDTFALLHNAPGIRGVFHCFTGDVAMARRALAIDFYVSFAGILTFPKAGDLREAAKIVPSERLLVETDSPYLAPVPHRGKRNEPAFVAAVLWSLAAIRSVEHEALEAELASNFRRLFSPSHAR